MRAYAGGNKRRHLRPRPLSTEGRGGSNPPRFELVEVKMNGQEMEESLENRVFILLY